MKTRGCKEAKAFIGEDLSNTLSSLAEEKTILLPWIPWHRKIGINEKADDLAWLRPRQPIFGPDPTVEISEA